jgi:SAM-dependent methyltransferase
MTSTRRPARRRAPLPDRHVLYEAAVQGVEYDLDFFVRVHRRLRGRGFTRFREDFCGTAALSCAWVLRAPGNRAWGVDQDGATLAWSRARHLRRLREAGERVRLVRADVRRARLPRADVICAMNFSYWVFHERRDLVAYFRAARRGLAEDGLLFVNAFGGTGAMDTLTETRRIAASRGPDGEAVPPFTYVWEHAAFNPVDHRLLCHIHFRLRDGRALERAFTYDWRMWTLPEIRDALLEAGFADVQVYVEGWDDARNAPDEVYRRRTRFEQQDGWLAVVVGVR